MRSLTAHHRLAVYGTLAPGRSNHDQLEALQGTWRQGFVHGHLVASGWGAAEGYPGIRLDPEAPRVDVQVLESPDLPEHWPRLDEFEGEEYERVIVTVVCDGLMIEACIYALRPEPTA
ncbi:MAG: gamma-glutamylcyclotransferase [Henriciella sp.]|nr:gamma-glutamylcyclotransferase [Henriciella sp.]